jgi:hypothetical protein
VRNISGPARRVDEEGNEREALRQGRALADVRGLSGGNHAGY